MTDASCIHDPRSARTTRILPFDAEAIYEAFEKPGILTTWWGPDGFTSTFEIFEFQTGGRWKFVLHGPNGTDYPNDSVFIELERSSKIVIEHVSQPHFILTVTLNVHGDGTELIWNQQFDAAEVAARIRHIVEPANEENLDRLTAALMRHGKV